MKFVICDLCGKIVENKNAEKIIREPDLIDYLFEDAEICNKCMFIIRNITLKKLKNVYFNILDDNDVEK